MVCIRLINNIEYWIRIKQAIFSRLPDDVFMIDLDSNKLIAPQEIPPLPEPEGTILKNHLKQVLN